MSTLQFKTNINCGNCLSKVTPVFNAEPRITHWEVNTADPDKLLTVSGPDISPDFISSLVSRAGYSVQAGSASPLFEAGTPGARVLPKAEGFWSSPPVWKRAAANTLNCLIGCTLGDFAVLVYFQQHPGTVPMYASMLPAMAAGLCTSLLLETVLLKWREGFTWSQAAATAFGMSFISMLVMELSENATDLALTGNNMPMSHPLYFWALAAGMAMGFLVPLPFNYYKLKKYGKGCH